ncbi:hypothetical protein SJI19_07950 [Acerihabitans sp. TG2]|nr:hypothetical protein [Acerihabitans sp. TG2]MEA9390472.1 hypothetical protein [Acerihabitans sp. TG2]
MLDSKSRIKLAKILCDNFNEGDWTELFAVCDGEDIPDGIYKF